MRKPRVTYDIWAIDAQGQLIEGTETKSIKGKQRALDDAIALFKTSPVKPWRVVIQPRHRRHDDD